MEEAFTKLSECISCCLLPKLSKEYHENSFYTEYQLRSNELQANFEKIEFLLQSIDFTQQSELASYTLSYLIIFYLELKSVAPWNTEQIKNKGYAVKLNEIFINKNNISIEETLQVDLFDCQVIFNECMKELHKKMTVIDFKKYPSLIEVYCSLVKNVKNYKINLNLVTVLPVALLLIDDYVTTNKVKGLQSCTAVLQSLTVEDLLAGNYYEVLYSSLQNNIVERDKEVTQALFVAFLEFLKLMPPDIKKNKLDDIFSRIVDLLITESNLYKKADCFEFLAKVIEMHGIHCAKKSIFKDIIRDNIDICSNEGVYEILLLRVLEEMFSWLFLTNKFLNEAPDEKYLVAKCFEMWLRYCWCIWQLSADHKMLSSLFKMLYISKEEATKLKIQTLIITLVKLCSQEQQMDILDNLDDPLKCSNEDFLIRLNTIKKQINS